MLATNSPNKLFDTFAAGRAGDREHGRLAARAGRAQRGRGLRPPGRPGGPGDECSGCATIPSAGRRSAATRAGLRRRSSTAECWPSGCGPCWSAWWPSGAAMKLSFCVVNTNGRELLLACLDAIERTRPADVEHEVLVLDNCSDDGSVGGGRGERPSRRPADRARPPRRQGRERLDAAARAHGRALPAAERGLGAAGRARARPARRARRRPQAAVPERSSSRAMAGRRPARGGSRRWTWRSPGSSLMHRLYTVQSRGSAHAGSGVDAVERDAGAPPSGRGRWASSTPTSSSTPTRPTSASASTTPAGACCSCPAARASTTTS